MKRNLLFAAFLLAVLAMAAAGVLLGHTARRCLCDSVDAACSAAGAGETRLQEADWLVRTLKLTPEQQVAVRPLEEQYRGTMATLCAAHCAARAQLQEVLFAAEANDAATRRLLDEMAAAQRASEQATVDHIRKIHRLLTPQQQQLFREAVLGSVCGGCRTRLHGCQETGNGPPANRTGMNCDMNGKEKQR